MGTRQFITPLVGMRFRPPAEDVVNTLPGGTELRVEFQEDNPYDSDALAVFLDGFEPGGKNEAIHKQLTDFFTQQGEMDKLQLFVSPLMLGFVANSEKTGGKWASTVKSYMNLDGRRSVPAKLAFDAQARPALEFNWSPEDEVADEHKIVMTSPLEAVDPLPKEYKNYDPDKKSLKDDLKDEIPF